MVKIILLSLIVFCFGYIGYGFSRYYVRRVKFFANCIWLCEKLEVEINFSKKKLSEIIESQVKNCSRDMQKCLSIYTDYLKDISNSFEDKINYEMTNLLMEEELNLFVLFLKSLGRLDVLNQLKEINNFKSKFNLYEKEAEKNNKTFGKLFIKLGIILGLLMVILLI